MQDTKESTSRVLLVRKAQPKKAPAPPIASKSEFEDKENVPQTDFVQPNFEIIGQSFGSFEDMKEALPETVIYNQNQLEGQQASPSFINHNRGQFYHPSKQVSQVNPHAMSPKSFHPSEQNQPTTHGLIGGPNVYGKDSSGGHDSVNTSHPTELTKELCIDTSFNPEPLFHRRNVNGPDKIIVELSPNSDAIKVELPGKTSISWSRSSEGPLLAAHQGLKQSEIQMLKDVHRAFNIFLYGPIESSSKADPVSTSAFNPAPTRPTGEHKVPPISKSAVNASEFLPNQHVANQYTQPKHHSTYNPSTGYSDRRMQYQKPYYGQAPHQLPSQTLGQGQVPHVGQEVGSNPVQSHHQFNQMPQQSGTFPAMQMAYGGQQPFMYPPQVPQEGFYPGMYNPMMYPQQMGMQPQGLPHPATGGNYAPSK